MIDATFWLAASSIIFVVLTYRPLKTNLISYLDKEINQIKRDISEAQSLKIEAEELVQDLKQKLAQYDQSHKALIERAKEQNDNHLKQHQAELELFINKRQKEISLKIEQLKLDAIKQIKTNLLTKSTDLTILYFKEQQDLNLSDTAIAKRLIQ